MASWFDIISLILTVGVVGGIIYGGVVISQAISQHVETTKTNLKKQGYTISDKGVSIKTNKRFDREDYVDATQRGFVKAVQNASFGKSQFSGSSPASSPGHSPLSSAQSSSFSPTVTTASSTLSPPPVVKRTSTQSSTGSTASDGKKKMRNPFKRTGSMSTS